MLSILYEYGENRLICLPIAFSWSLPRLVYHLDTGPRCNSGTTRPSQHLYRLEGSRNIEILVLRGPRSRTAAAGVSTSSSSSSSNSSSGAATAVVVLAAAAAAVVVVVVVVREMK
jgi:hypothetical protein